MNVFKNQLPLHKTKLEGAPTAQIWDNLSKIYKDRNEVFEKNKNSWFHTYENSEMSYTHIWNNLYNYKILSME